MKKFIKESSRAENLQTVVKNLFEILDIPVLPQTIDEIITGHPEGGGLMALQDSLDRWRIKNMAVKLEGENLKEIDAPCITMISDKGTSFIILKGLNGSGVEYLHTEKGWINEPVESFVSKWNGITILVQKEDQSGETHYSEKLKDSRNATKIRQLGYSSLLALVILMSIILVDEDPDFLPSFVIKLIGLGISLLLVIKSYNPQTSFLDKFCKMGAQKDSTFDCGQVINSKSGRLFSWLSWAEAGFLYFLAGLITIIFGSMTSFQVEVLQGLYMITLLSLPITLLSIGAQAFVLRKWCLLCLTVILVLWADIFALSYVTSFEIGLTSNTWLFLTMTHALPFASWLLLSPVIKYYNKFKMTKAKLNQYELNPSIRKALIDSGEKCTEVQLKDELQLGNPDSERELIAVVSMSCSPCQTFLQRLADTIDNFQDFNIKIRFMGMNNNDTTAINLSQSLRTLSKQNLLPALVEWFDVQDIVQWQAKWNANKDAFDQKPDLDKMQQWITENSILQTPTLLYNGRKQFRVIDLKDLLIY